MSNKQTKDAEKYKQTPVFKDAIILMVSLLHGSLFFTIAGNTIELINAFSYYKLSILLFDYTIFLRVFQTHILAAIKYDRKWDIRPLDYVWLFCTALFEYILFNSKDINGWNDTIRNYVIIGFCIVGIVGYALSYFRTKDQYHEYDRAAEQIIQSTNIMVLAVVGGLHIIKAVIKYEDSIPNYLCAAWIMINIYKSMQSSIL